MEVYQDTFYTLARTVAAESAVLIKNDHQTLPLCPNETVSIFGRIQTTYYKSGTGSGGLVNVPYVVSIPEGLAASGQVSINQELAKIYQTWIASHPFDNGSGWAQEPWSQEEMPLTDELVKQAASQSDAALIVIGRTAGEDQDSTLTPGSYLLTDTEKDMIRKVCAHFKRTAVLLNVGNIIDMSWVEEFHVPAVLYVWQGGMEGGNGVADVLTGKTSPCGKLSDTIARSIEDYPSHKNFGDPKSNTYEEDIYVGYRYFETFAPDKVLYPFGFGLSYTTFSTTCLRTSLSHGADLAAPSVSDQINLLISVKNTGTASGKEVVQIYFGAPQGSLGKPAKVLAAFQKTRLLAPGESQILHLSFPLSRMASYDDSGITGHKSCWVLEEGQYDIFMGTNVRETSCIFSMTIPSLLVSESLEEALSPVQPFQRLKPLMASDSHVCRAVYEDVPTRSYNLAERIASRRPAPFTCTEHNASYTLSDVANNTVSMQDFIAQLSPQDLMCIVRGEGMCSPKVTPGTASALGGLTPSLQSYGIPAGCCSDGPSGIRMDCGTEATSIPNGTAIACTWNTELAEELFICQGQELEKNHIDTILGPGINIHRHPLNGRNFEYFSEDPYLTGELASAELRGLHHTNATGTIKHFCCNNQETARHENNSVVSERALREIYLKPFEIAVKEGNARSIMTSYNAINSIWAAGNYDLNTTILRDQWGFHGLVMTDWWADINEEGGPSSKSNTRAMVRAQNDVYMVVEDAYKNTAHDNLEESLADGSLTIGELQRCASNICHFLLQSPAFLSAGSDDDNANADLLDASIEGEQILEDKISLSLEGVDTSRGKQIVFPLYAPHGGTYRMELHVRATAPDLAQLPVSVFRGSHLLTTFMVHDTQAQWICMEKEITLRPGHFYLKIAFGMAGSECRELKFFQIN